MEQKNFVILETNKPDQENQASYLFENPAKIIKTHKLSEVKACLKNIEKHTKNGYFAAGFVSYEAGYAFENRFISKDTFNFPLVWFGIFKKAPRCQGAKVPRKKQKKYKLWSIRNSISKKEYLKNIKEIKKYIKDGDAYQVNYTFKNKFNFSGDPYRLYEDLKQKQATAFSAFISAEKNKIISLSPELFFRVKNNKISVKPMKGTIERGKTLAEDLQKQKNLHKSAKNKAENLMIVDLLRNDLGKICKPGSVATKKLFEVEKFNTLYQMTSTIEGKLNKNTGFYKIFKALFPSGSVTGAPKIRTMQIIKELEKEPRKVYCGAIGFISPNKEMVFNVAIRTIILQDKHGEMGIGGGITYISDTQKEFEEAKLKADFLTKNTVGFKLIETMRWEPKINIKLLPYHMKRLSRSANYFGFKLDKKQILKQIKKTTKHLKSPNKIRLLLSKNGKFAITTSLIEKTSNKPVKICLSKIKTNSNNTFFYHKTTKRKLYNQEHKKYAKKGFFDVVFLNEKGQITEGAISNIIIKKGRHYYTPPIKCGVLAGTYREFLLKESNFPIKEKILYMEDIKKADKIYLCNAVSGLIQVGF